MYVAPEAWQERMNPTRSDAVDSSAQSRLLAWEYARRLAADYPITGGGFATFTAELYARYWPGEFSSIYGAHSVYFQVLAEHGYVGLALYLALVLSCFMTLRRVRRKARAKGDTTMALYAQMFQLSLIGFLVPGSFLGRAYFDYYFTIVACVIILDQVARKRWEPNDQSGEKRRSCFGTGSRLVRSDSHLTSGSFMKKSEPVTAEPTSQPTKWEQAYQQFASSLNMSER